MSRKAPREVLESLEAFLRRCTSLSDDDIRARINGLRSHKKAGGPPREPFGRADVLRGPDAPRSAGDGSPTSDHARVAREVSAVTRLVHGQGDDAGTIDPRLGEFRARYPTARAPIEFPAHAVDAVDLPPDDVYARLTRMKDDLLERLEAGEVPCVALPDLHSANAIYDERGNVFLGHNVRHLTLDRKQGKEFMRLLLTLEVAFETSRQSRRITKRNLYYLHRGWLAENGEEQRDSDRALTALAHLLGVRRKALGIVEERRGIVFGRLVLRDGTAIIDLSQVGRGGRTLPRFVDEVEILGSDAAFILVVEKHAVALQLDQARWAEKARCIVVCSEGFPSMSAREFVRTLVDTLRIPAFVCTDADPAGARVALTFAHGSICSALETPWLACNDIWWLGLQASDIPHYERGDLIRLSDTDKEEAQRLIEHPSTAYVGRRMREELALLVGGGVKMELDSIAGDPARFVDDYLPKKLFDSELVKL